MESWTILGLGSIIAVVCGITAIKVFTLRQLDPLTVRNKEKLRTEYIKDLEDEVAHWKKQYKSYQAKFANAKQLDKLEIGSIPDTADGIRALIDENLPYLANQLPKEVRELINSNKDRIAEYAAAHPEQAKQYLQRFIKTGSAQAEQQTGGTQSRIPNFGVNGTV